MGLGGSEAICQPLPLEDPVITAIFVDLESYLSREFCIAGAGASVD